MDKALHIIALKGIILEKCRKVVQEIWFEKSGSRKMVLQTRIFFSGSRKVVDQKNRSDFEEPLF